MEVLVAATAPVPTSTDSPERIIVADYVLERLITAFVHEEYEEADRMSRFHAVLLGMSDGEYLETT